MGLFLGLSDGFASLIPRKLFHYDLIRLADEDLCRNAQSYVQGANHRKAEATLAIQHFGRFALGAPIDTVQS